MLGNSRVHGRALVLGNDTRAFLSVVRSLGRAGIEVDVGGVEAGAPAAVSRYIARHHELPAYSASEAGWQEALAAVIRARSFDLVIPCPDWAVMALDTGRRALEPLTRLAIPSETALATFMDKTSTRDLADSLGVPAPREWRIESLSGLAPLSHESFPLFVKPVTSFNPKDPTRKRVVTKARSWEALYSAVEHELEEGGLLIVQRSVVGRGVGVEVLARRGEIIADFQHERVHEPTDGGGSTYRRSCRVSPQLRAFAGRLVAACEFTGVAMVEFRQAPNGEAWLMEVNPRFWGSLPLALAAGADFPAALFDLLVYDRLPKAWAPAEDVYCRNPRSDMQWWRDRFRSDSLPEVAAALTADISRAIARAPLGRERLDTLVRDDPEPGIAEVRGLLARFRGAILLRLASTGLVRLLLRRRARRALRRSTRIWFLCKGNICRSPFAARLAQAENPRVTVLSSGYRARSGRSSPSDAVTAAETFGVDLRDHRSSPARPVDISASDVVFVFDLEGWTAARGQLRVSPRHLHFVGALVTSGPLQIGDPWGCDRRVFLDTYQRIADALGSSQAVEAQLGSARR